MGYLIYFAKTFIHELHKIMVSYNTRKYDKMSFALAILLFTGIYAIAFSIGQYSTVQAQSNNNATHLLLLPLLLLLLLHHL